MEKNKIVIRLTPAQTARLRENGLLTMAELNPDGSLDLQRLSPGHVPVRFRQTAVVGQTMPESVSDRYSKLYGDKKFPEDSLPVKYP